MAKDMTHAIIQNVNGTNHVKTLHALPTNSGDLLSVVVVINHKYQLTVWYSKELPAETAQTMANKFADDMRKDLGS